MRKLLVSLAVASATLAAVPAAAQYHDASDRRWDQRDDRRDGRDRRGPDRWAISSLLVQIDRVDQRTQRSLRRGMISPREALGVRRDASRIRDRLHRAARNGLSGREFAQLQTRVNRLEQRLRIERRDRDGRRF